jgi:hypothetical protein
MSSTLNSTTEYVKKDMPPILVTLGRLLTVVGLVLVVLAYFTDGTRSAFNNLILLMFLTSIGLGSLFLAAVEYIAGAVWSTPFRRIAEILGSILLIVPIVAIPVYFNLHDLYHWTHLDAVATDKILKHKSPYLDEVFFTIRIVGYFIIWILFYLIITKNSLKQDITKDQVLTKKNVRNSAIFIPFFAITITFASIDWMMSLEPHWFSTIFGVYYFSGTFLSALAIITFLVVYLNEKGVFGNLIVKDHYYSFGALLYGFVNFLAYIAISQFMLIWYANLPEETFWFLNRWEGSWLIFTVLFILIHFIVPFFALVSQPSKTNGARLKFMSIWLLVAHFMDLYFLVMPTFSPEGVVLGWIELGYFMLAFGIVLLIFVYRAKSVNLLPIGDPKLKRGLDFRL